MSQQIRRFGIGQTAKVVAVLYALVSLLFLPALLTLSHALPGWANFGAGLAVLVPVLYGILGFIAAAIACAVYNLVARWVGGIEVELEGSSSGG